MSDVEEEGDIYKEDDENSVVASEIDSDAETASIVPSEMDSDVEEDEKEATTGDIPASYSSDQDNELSEDEDELAKFDDTIRKGVIEMYHPEAKTVNQAEMLKMATVTRNERGIIVDDLHRSIPMMTKYEYSSILGERAQQIDKGDSPMIKVPPGVMDSYLIAQMELDQKRIPFIIKRPIPGNGFEYWHVEDLEIVHEPIH